MFPEYPGGFEGLMHDVAQSEPPAIAAIEDLVESAISSLEGLMDFAALVESNVDFKSLRINTEKLLRTAGLDPELNKTVKFKFLAREALEPRYSFSFSWQPVKTFTQQVVGPIVSLSIEPQVQARQKRGILIFNMKDPQQINLPDAPMYQLEEHESVRYDNESQFRASQIKRWELPRYISFQAQLLEELIALVENF